MHANIHFSPYIQCVLPHVIFISFKIILYEQKATQRSQGAGRRIHQAKLKKYKERKKMKYQTNPTKPNAKTDKTQKKAPEERILNATTVAVREGKNGLQSTIFMRNNKFHLKTEIWQNYVFSLSLFISCLSLNQSTCIWVLSLAQNIYFSRISR